MSERRGVAGGASVKGTLKKKRDFDEVYERGLKSVGRRLVAFALSSDSDDPARRDEPGVLVGVVASRKVGNAVRRARAKRVLRAAFAELRPRIPRGTRIVLVARHPITGPEVRSQDVRRELGELLERVGCLSQETR